MQDQRIANRWVLTETPLSPLNVYNEYNEYLGEVGNISETGLCVFCLDPVHTSETVQLKMDLPEKIKGKKQIKFKVNTVWCNETDNLSPTGFHIIDIKNDDQQIIDYVIKEYGFLA